MRAAFLGTPASAVPSLAALVDVADVVLVVTRPDRRRGRGARPTPSPVKIAALEWGFPVAQPEDAATLQRLLAPLSLDLALVVAFGMILPPEVLATTRLGFVNVHFSLLPRWRGAAPVARAILAGDEKTGVSLMLIDAGLDTGPVIAAVGTPIAADETRGSLTARLAHLGALLVDERLPAYVAGRSLPVPQLSTGTSRARPLSREEARITPSWEARRAERAVRAFHPRPGAWVEVEGRPLRILAARLVAAATEPGRIVARDGRPVLGLVGGGLELRTVHPAGRTPQDGRSWLNGRRGAGGTIAS